MIIDDQPDDVVIWYQEALTTREVAQMLADVWTVNASCGQWRRTAA